MKNQLIAGKAKENFVISEFYDNHLISIGSHQVEKGDKVGIDCAKEIVIILKCDGTIIKMGEKNGLDTDIQEVQNALMLFQ